MSPLDDLAPDQRAVVQLVLQQGRSYDELAGLLGIPADAVRSRAHAGLAALAGRPEPADDGRGRLSDFLLGQQGVGEREATRERLEDSAEARSWARDVADRLRDVAGDALPEIPDEAEEEQAPEVAELPAADLAAAATPSPPEEAEPELARPAPRPRPLRDRAAAAPLPVGEEPAAESGRGDEAPPSSKLGGAMLIGGLAILLAVLLVVLLRGDDDDGGGGTTATTAPTQTATAAQPQAVGQIQLRGPGDSRARGTMTIFAQDSRLGFTLEATDVPASREGEAYAVWFVNRGGSARRLGFTQPVGEDGRLGLSGPRQEDVANFPRWLSTYRQVVVSRETTEDTRRPGPVVLRGNLPRSGS